MKLTNPQFIFYPTLWNQHQKGLTLFELLVVLAITSILIGIAVPSMANFVRQAESVSLSNQLIGLVHYARTASISQGVTITICGSGDSLQCDNQWSKHILIFADKNDNGELDEEDHLLQDRSLFNPGDKLIWRSFRNKPYLQLHPTGITYYQNGNFTYCPADKNIQYSRHWILNISGHLRLARDTNGNGILENTKGKDIHC